MNALQTVNNMAVVPAAALQLNLFDEFVSFIDRSEKTAQTYITNLRQFAAWLQYSAITRPTRADVMSYRDYLAAEHDSIRLDTENADGWTYNRDRMGNILRTICKPNTVAQYLRSVCQFFRWTSANGYYPNVAENIHAPKIRHDAHRKEALTAADVVTIESTIETSTERGKRLYAMYLLAVNAGMRTIELERANVKDIEVKNGNAVIYIWGKGHSEADQKKPIAPEVYAAVKEYLAARTDRPNGNSPLFVATGNRSGGKRIAARTISQMLKQAMKQAGYDSERITAHSLRHTAGTAVMELTGNLYTTQKYMRHSNPATTEIYLHNETEKQDAATAQNLYNYFHGLDNGSGVQMDSLLQAIKTMNAEQIAQLSSIAAAMTR